MDYFSKFAILLPSALFRIWIWKVRPRAPLTFHQHYCELWIANLAFDSNYFEWRACHPFEFPTMILTQAELWLQPPAQWVTSDTRVPVNNSLSARTLPANKSPSNRNFLVHSIQLILTQLNSTNNSFRSNFKQLRGSCSYSDKFIGLECNKNFATRTWANIERCAQVKADLDP